MGSNSEPYNYPKHWLGQPRPLRVVVVGAGISGIAAVKIYKEVLGNLPITLTLYDKNNDVGGTWLENKYPGCSCDIPAHSYTYSWEGNPSWSRMYVEAEEIFNFYKGRAQAYGVFEYLKLRHQVHEAVWNKEKGKWILSVENLTTKQVIVDEAEVLINAGGFLKFVLQHIFRFQLSSHTHSKWKWPEVKGLKCFQGTLLHSAVWNDSISFKRKTVAVIGSGSSAIQIVPRLQKDVTHLYSINRSPTWITPKYASEHIPNNPEMSYTEQQKKDWADSAEKLLSVRKAIDTTMIKGFEVNYKGSDMQAEMFKVCSQDMHAILSKKAGLSDLLIPTFGVGCRRLTPGVGYLEALVEDNVTVIGESIEKITPNSIVTKSGIDLQVDIIICATGFDTSYRPSFHLRGQHDQDLKEVWAEKPRSYLSLAVPGFPNYFVAGGPNFPIANGSLINSLEASLKYAFEAVRKIQRQNIKSLHPSRSAVDDFQEYKDAIMNDMVWTSNCRSWYKKGKVDGEVWGPWPGSALHYRQLVEEPRWEDYEIEYLHPNRFHFLGNGRTEPEMTGGDVTYYLTEPAREVR
ncbi:steroid monooxygenase [Stagonosporopsis vannaccii]|nr:steroid monooxygenase [Stagonosporopsis vannaccii]